MTVIQHNNDFNLRKQLSALITALEDAQGYALSVGCGLTAAPADATTYYFAAFHALALENANGIVDVYVPRAGTITAAQISSYASGTAGSNESWTLSIRVNDTTDYAIAAVTSNAGGVRVWSNTGLAVAVARGDRIAIKTTTPTWATNPTDVYFGGHVFVK